MISRALVCYAELSRVKHFKLSFDELRLVVVRLGVISLAPFCYGRSSILRYVWVS